MKYEPLVSFVWVLKDVINSVGVKRGRAAFDAMHLIALFQQKLRKIRTVLTRDAAYECSFPHIPALGFSFFYLSKEYMNSAECNFLLE